MAAFNQERSDEALHVLARRVLADPSYAGDDWWGIALVIQIDGRLRMFGYLYGSDGWKPEVPGDFDVLDDAETLADAMAADGARWKRCLLHITRTPGGRPELKAEFDYDGTAEWEVTPANVDEMVDTLRPAMPAA